ncbi:SMP-30/gluconolactonase/LRE family protein [Desertihabitans aurantiacus]|uniref:SMP-30/gluconolactonase/LRE family protein n=1 Tax=Desertihabitans aurantiacus TaxID=2282477 RepID=UPI001300672B|nr:SMP-30/gluconolactonase/LRE family protein [Desertihabitans aurantiacus]
MVVGAVLLTPVLALAVFFLSVRAPVNDFSPEPWRPGEPAAFPPDVTAPADVSVFTDHTIHGPEDIVLDGEGNLYTGDRDGVIWRFAALGGAPERFADTGGRPLGLAFAPDGRLIVADHGAGLLAVHPDGTVETLVSQVAGRPVLFANDLDISADGVVYFSDSSFRYNTHTLGEQSSSYLLPDAIDGRASGRLLSHDLTTGRSEVLLDDIYFPNGVALTADGSTLWLAESNRYRVLEYDLASGSTQTVYENLPGTPDNIDRDAEGRMLVAIYDRNAALDALVLPYTVSRHVLIRLPSHLFVNEEEPLRGSILVARDDGTTVRHLTGLTPAATSVHPAGDRWYLGALLGQPVRWIAAP